MGTGEKREKGKAVQKKRTEKKIYNLH